MRIDIPHRCSRTLLVFYGGAIFLQLSALLIFDVSVYVRVLAFLFCCFGFWQIWKSVNFFRRLHKIVVREDYIDLYFGTHPISVNVTPGCVVSEFLIALSFKPLHSDRGSHFPKRLILLRDSISEHHHHCLRLLLKQGKLSSSSVA